MASGGRGARSPDLGLRTLVPLPVDEPVAGLGIDGGEDDEKLKGELYKVDTSKLQPAQPQEFEKDGK